MLRRLLNSAGHWIARQMGYTEQVMAARVPGMPNTMARIAVTEQTALRFASCYACIRCIAETKGSLPYEVIERNKSGFESVTRLHPVADLLEYEPYEDMTSMVWSENRQSDVLTGGNSYCEIVWNNDGTIAALIPRHWSLVRPFRDEAGHLMYEVRQSPGSSNIRVLDRSQMLHVPGFGNGIVGWSPIRLQAETIGIGLAQDKFAAAYFGNSAKPSIVVQTAGTLQDDAYNRLKHEMEVNFTGDNAHKPLLIEQAEVKPLFIPANEAQFLESREYQEEVICRIYRVPPHMIGLLRRATFSNIEAQDLSYEKHTIRPWLIRDEKELNRKLFLKSERGRFFVRHNVDDLLRADIKTRYDAYKTAILTGFKSRNEVRATEHLAPVDGGDKCLLPESIFGKSGNGGSSDGKNVQGDNLASRRQKAEGRRRKRSQMDPRLSALTMQTVSGLLSREITHAERAAGKPEQFRDLVASAYAKHDEVLRDKLTCFRDATPMLEASKRHKAELLGLADSQHLAEDLDALTATWKTEIESISQSLLAS